MDTHSPEPLDTDADAHHSSLYLRECHDLPPPDAQAHVTVYTLHTKMF